MVFSKKYKLIHQGTGTVGSGGWTDLGKQSVFVFDAYSSGVLRVGVVVKRGGLVQKCWKHTSVIRMSIYWLTVYFV